MRAALVATIAIIFALALTYASADYFDIVQQDFAPVFSHSLRKVKDDFTVYRETAKGWEFDALIVSSIETKYYTQKNHTNVQNWGVHGIWEPAGARVDVKDYTSKYRPEWVAAKEKRNPDNTVATLRANIQNEITTNVDQWIHHFKSIKPDGDAAFRNHEWSKHGTNLPMSMRQFANSIASKGLGELMRVCAANAELSVKNGKPINIVINNVITSYGKISLSYVPANGYVDCRSTGVIYINTGIVKDDQVEPIVTLY